ncbi:MAG: hypothetical protein ACI9DJ_001351 [Algoriphagus sp.]|jgi:hypothetical protein
MIIITRNLSFFKSFLVMTWLIIHFHPFDGQGQFEKMSYENIDLKVDLGVGLWAWPLPMDFDHDGDIDLIVSCPDKPSNGIYFFENKSGVNAKEVLFEPGVRLTEGFKNLQISYLQDGTPKVLGPGVEYQNFEEKLLSDPKTIFNKEALEKRHQKIRFSQWKYVDYEGDGDFDIMVGIDDWVDYGWDNAFDTNGKWTNGPLHGFVYLLENIGGEFINKGKIKAGNEPIDLYGAPSPNLYDFDGDGDLDLICGDFLDRFTWFENIGSRSKPLFRKGQFLKNEDGPIKMDLQMIIPTGIDWDKDGDIDLVVGDEDGRVALLENLGRAGDKMPLFSNPMYFKQKAEYVKFGALVTPFGVDWDDDGDDDLICGNSAGYISFIENLGSQKWAEPSNLKVNDEVIRYQAGENGSIQGPAEAKWGYTTLSVADWDGDGLRDIIVNSIFGKVEWFKNIGRKGVPKLSLAQPILVDWNTSEIPKPKWNWWNPGKEELVTQWRTTPNAIDWNNDGMMDLIMLDHQGFLAYFERSSTDMGLKLKPGERIFYGSMGSAFTNNNEIINLEYGPLQLNVSMAGGSGRRKWCFTDWDNDGDLDIIINGKNVSLFENLGMQSGKVNMAYKGNISEQVLAGHTTSPTMIKFDNSEKKRLLVGGEDGFLYLYK